MKRFCLGLALGLVPMSVGADGPGARAPTLADGRGRDCGGDAYTFAEVVPAQRGVRTREPIMVLPDTLCADLTASPATRIESLNVFIDPRAPAEEQAKVGPGRTAPYRPY